MMEPDQLIELIKDTIDEQMEQCEPYRLVGVVICYVVKNLIAQGIELKQLESILPIIANQTSSLVIVE